MTQHTLLLSADQQQSLKLINATKRVTVIVVKWKYPFFTKLENFHKPKDAALIGIFAEQMRLKIHLEAEQHFDMIFWYKTDYTDFEHVYVDSNGIELPEARNLMERIASIISPSKLRVLDTEEYMIDFVCKLRKELAIPGPFEEDLTRLRDKAILKDIIYKNGIPTAKYDTVNFGELDWDDVDSKTEDVYKQIGVFPMFRKPTSGCGSGGGGRIDSKAELAAWIRQELSDGQTSTYLIEERLAGRQFTAVVCLLPNGQWRPIYILHTDGIPVAEALNKGIPIPFIGRRFEDFEDDFPEMEKFVGSAIETLKPPHPHVFCVQGFQVNNFQLKSGTPSYMFMECGYRQNGARGTGLSYGASGVSLETALIQCHLDENYEADPDPNRPKTYEAHLWWPFKKGVLRSHNALPARSPVTSKVEFNWNVPSKTRLCVAQSVAHFVVWARIRNADSDTLEEDLQWLMTNWRPDIILDKEEEFQKG
ncbi:hypothetical protein DdX_15017 [Ditylenchus destructor]|uniref:ATP-grasp domain-containing protein n=1 Tax=Ditylenchus destructor TaxID=166010 RepID=A0AAD4MVU7_9BILA|nr:hypothetical protein DdX_15017 [Ditylenchus destructor]